MYLILESQTSQQLQSDLKAKISHGKPSHLGSDCLLRESRTLEARGSYLEGHQSKHLGIRKTCLKSRINNAN